MTPPIAIQLYTVRDALAHDYAGVIRHLEEIGYDGVEPAAFTGIPENARELFDAHGLAVPSVHLDLPVGEKRAEVLDTAHRLGAGTIVFGGVGPERYATPRGVREMCDLFNEANAAATAEGLHFAIHNHPWEFEPLDGTPRYKHMLEHLEPTILWEVDTYWVKTAGMDPAAVLRELGPRAPLLHIKDGPARWGEPMVAVGQGVLDFDAILAAHAEHTEWLIVELDTCETDMLEAVEESYQFLKRRVKSEE